MIPKIIHFCWMSGDAYPEKIKKCIESWKQKLPDYEIWLWDTNRFDINQSIWVKEAFEAKRYAFCADYIRCYALYNYGGVYLDSDVEVLKSYDNLLEMPYFIGMESAGFIEAATMGAEAHHPFFKKMLDYYENRHFLNEKGEPNLVVMPEVIMSILRDNFKLKEITSIQEFDKSSGTMCYFPYQFFSPIDTSGKRYVLRTSLDTYSIHHFANSWVLWQGRLLVFLFGKTSKMAKLRNILVNIRNKYRKIKCSIRK